MKIVISNITSETSKIDISDIYDKLIVIWKNTNINEEKYKIIIETNDNTLTKIRSLGARLLDTDHFDVEIVKIPEKNNQDVINFIDLREINLDDLENINLNYFDKNKIMKLVDKYRSSKKMKKITSLLNQNGFYNIEYLEESIIQ